MAHIISKLGPPKGFHPVSITTIQLPEPRSSYNSCALLLYYTLPPLLFVDTHELAQRDASYTFKHWGSRDLEKPVHALPDEPSELLLDIRFLQGKVGHPQAEAEEGKTTAVDVEVPMHLRYGKPRAAVSSNPGNEEKTGPYEEIHVDWPKAFLRCSSTDPTNSLNHTSIPLPQHVLFALPSSDKATVILAVPPHVDFASKTNSTLFLPLGNPNDLAIVEGVTVFTMILCFIFLMQTSYRTAVRLANDAARPKTA